MAWNGSDGGAVNSTQSVRENAKAGERVVSRTHTSSDLAAQGELRSGDMRPTKMPVRGLVALAIVVVGGVLVWWWVVGSRASVPDVPEVADIPSRIKEQRPAAVALKCDPSNAGERPRGTHDSAEPTTAVPPHKQIVEMISVITNADGSVLERYRTADGKTRSRQSAPKPVFDNASDQVIAMAVSGAASGGSMPPMPMMDNADEAFAKSLEKEIVINDDDSEKIKALKREVMSVREEMRQLIADGQSFTDVMKEHRDMVNRNAELRKEAMRILEEFVESGDADGARECLEKVNAALGEAGIDGIAMPMSREERRAAIRERNTNAENK